MVKDARLGSSKVPLRLAAELDRLGVKVTTVFREDLPHLPQAKVDEFSSPFRMAWTLRDRAAAAHVVDVAGWDGWAYGAWARRRRPRQLLVARSNGLWTRSQPFKDNDERSAGRRFVSRYAQAQLCRWEQRSIREADLVLFGARSDAEYVVEHGWKRAEQIAVVPPGGDDVFASSVPLEARTGIFYVGSFMHQKGGDVAADAMALVLAERPAATATFVGPGVPASLILERFPEAVRPRVRIVEKVPAARVAEELSTGAILLFPALYEGFGMVVLEAMRAGLVVVATRTGAGAEVVRDSVNGLTIPFADPQSAADAAKRLLDDAPLRLRLARAAVEETQGRTWTATASALLAAYRGALQRLTR